MFFECCIGILLYSYSLICFASIYGLRRSVLIDLCELSEASSPGGRFSNCYPIFCGSPRFFFLSGFRSSNSLSMYACVKKECLSCATSDEDVVTSIGLVYMSCRILRRIFSVTMTCSLESKSAVFTEPAKCATLKLNWNTYMRSTAMVEWFCMEKRRDFRQLSVRLLPLLFPHKKCKDSRNAKEIAQNSFQ